MTGMSLTLECYAVMRLTALQSIAHLPLPPPLRRCMEGLVNKSEGVLFLILTDCI